MNPYPGERDLAVIRAAITALIAAVPDGRCQGSSGPFIPVNAPKWFSEVEPSSSDVGQDGNK
ncbi:MAG: hypothetical protein JWM76_2428 [Pseudonocardiales bacterium]|nr:hypothetical protein [Pseudonocardiales bacterium]